MERREITPRVESEMTPKTEALGEGLISSQNTKHLVHTCHTLWVMLGNGRR